MTTQRKKPIKLEITTDLISSTTNDDAVAVRIRGQAPANAPQKVNVQESISLKGTVKLRRETKGRAGKPVSVLYGFDDPAVSSPGALKSLQARLKEGLACGGTFDDAAGEIVLQVDDLSRVRQFLGKLGFTVKG